MEKCPNCGYCKECGRSDRYVPAPVPYYPAPWWPWSVEPYAPYEPAKRWIWTSGRVDFTGTTPPQLSSTNVTITLDGRPLGTFTGDAS